MGAVEEGEALLRAQGEGVAGARSGHFIKGPRARAGSRHLNTGKQPSPHFAWTGLVEQGLRPAQRVRNPWGSSHGTKANPHAGPVYRAIDAAVTGYLSNFAVLAHDPRDPLEGPSLGVPRCTSLLRLAPPAPQGWAYSTCAAACSKYLCRPGPPAEPGGLDLRCPVYCALCFSFASLPACPPAWAADLRSILGSRAHNALPDSAHLLDRCGCSTTRNQVSQGLAPEDPVRRGPGAASSACAECVACAGCVACRRCAEAAARATSDAAHHHGVCGVPCGQMHGSLEFLGRLEEPRAAPFILAPVLFAYQAPGL